MGLARLLASALVQHIGCLVGIQGAAGDDLPFTSSPIGFWRPLYLSIALPRTMGEATKG